MIDQQISTIVRMTRVKMVARAKITKMLISVIVPQDLPVGIVKPVCVLCMTFVYIATL